MTSEPPTPPTPPIPPTPSASPTQDADRRTILIVEDDASLRETLAYNLRGEGYAVLMAADGLTALEITRHNRVALVLLDLMLPRLDGLEVCRLLRTNPATQYVPIVMLTARGEETDTILGLEVGADDYVAKPFKWSELRARIRALLRRSELQLTGIAHPGREDASKARVFSVADIMIDLDRREVHWRGRPVELNGHLFDLLAYLMQNRGIVLSRDRILEHVWGYDYTGETRTVDVYMRLLREKLEVDPSHPEKLLTVRGVGYRFKD